MARIRPFARAIAGIALVAVVLWAGGAAAGSLESEDPDDLTVQTRGLDSLRHTEGTPLEPVDDGATETLDREDTGKSETLDAADSGSSESLDAADTGHTVSLDAADPVEMETPGH